jgi:hypothetical protein
MAFDWSENLTLARWLMANPPPGVSPEAVHRDAIGRAYYAAFNHALDYATQFLGYSPKGHGDDHGALRAHLKLKKRAQVAVRLDRLRGWRNLADYESDQTTDFAASAVLAISDAEYVFKALEPPKPKPGEATPS